MDRGVASRRGRQNKILGDDLEEWLNHQHALAGRLGVLAHVEKTQAKSKVVDGRLIYEKPGVADYIGCLEGARYLAVEAKSTDDERLPRSRVEPKQQEHLTAVALAGGLSVLVVEFRGVENRRYALPWREVPWVVLRTAESVREADIVKWRIDPGACYLLRWHSGGPRSGSHFVGEPNARPRVFPRE